MKNQIMHALLSITLTAALATAVTAAPNDTNSASLSVANAYVRAMPPGQSKTVGFLEITNTGTQICRLVSAHSTLSNRLEFHEHRHVQGMMRMRQVAEVEISAGQTVVFEPGGLHIMLFNLTSPLQAGDSTQMQLVTDQCGSVSFNPEVRSLIKNSKPMDGMRH